jgi:hypothetical protein
MIEVIRAEIIGDNYQVGDITTGSLPGLCIKLLAAGFDPEASVECYRPGREAWYIRANSIRAAARLAIAGNGVGFRVVGASPVSDQPQPGDGQPSEPEAHGRASTPRGSEGQP